jgi:alkaline phosphatase
MQKHLILGLLSLFAGAAAVAQQIKDPKVILIIGDGMDDQQIAIARNYLKGMSGRLVLDRMEERVSAQVRTVYEIDPGRPKYVGDSASGATAMATGVAVSEGRIGTTAGTDQDLPNIMEMAMAAGLQTGIVTTSRITDASPSSFVAHIGNRYCEVPDDMVKVDEHFPQDSTDCSADYKSNGGSGSIVEQIADSDLNLIFGGGSGRFDAFIDGVESETVGQTAKNNGWVILRSPEEIESAPKKTKLLGLFAAGHLPERWRGVDGAEAEWVESVDGVPVWPEPFECEVNPEFEGAPTLAELTKAALDILDEDAGFMLVVESASIDKASHYWRPCGHIGELAQLDETTQLALDYAAEHPETLVLVTADHGSSAQLIPQQTELSIQNAKPPGRFAKIRTPEGGVMGINYATNDSPFWENHSGVHVPLYVQGPGADNLPEFLYQTDVFHIAATHLGLSDTWPEY